MKDKILNKIKEELLNAKSPKQKEIAVTKLHQHEISYEEGTQDAINEFSKVFWDYWNCKISNGKMSAYMEDLDG